MEQPIFLYIIVCSTYIIYLVLRLYPILYNYFRLSSSTTSSTTTWCHRLLPLRWLCCRSQQRQVNQQHNFERNDNDEAMIRPISIEQRREHVLDKIIVQKFKVSHHKNTYCDYDGHENREEHNEIQFSKQGFIRNGLDNKDDNKENELHSDSGSRDDDDDDDDDEENQIQECYPTRNTNKHQNDTYMTTTDDNNNDDGNGGGLVTKNDIHIYDHSEQQASSDNGIPLNVITCSKNNNICSICLGEYEKKDDICKSKNTECQHHFHLDCMVPWLMYHNDCPLCRKDWLKEFDSKNHCHETGIYTF